LALKKELGREGKARVKADGKLSFEVGLLLRAE